MTHIISLIPLDPQYHVEALQAVYRATPSYWQMYNLPGCPPDQAAKDLQAVGETPGRAMTGIVRRIDPANPDAGMEMIGILDFRLHWPTEDVVYVGMLMTADSYQRQGVGTQAWSLLKPWLIRSAMMARARLGVEQFNHRGLKFWQSLGFVLTGESNRVRVGDKLVRLLYMEQEFSLE